MNPVTRAAGSACYNENGADVIDETFQGALVPSHIDKAQYD